MRVFSDLLGTPTRPVFVDVHEDGTVVVMDGRRNGRRPFLIVNPDLSVVRGTEGAEEEVSA